MRTRIEAPSALLEAAGVLLEGGGGMLLTTNLNKALFYLDAHSLLEFGKLATNDLYVALEHGPVIEGYNGRLINALEVHSIATQDTDNPNYKPVYLTNPVKPSRLTEAQVKLALGIGKWAHAKSATELENYSHENAAWKMAFKEREGTEIDMRIAMQQLLDADAWMKAEWTEDEKVLLSLTLKEEGFEVW